MKLGWFYSRHSSFNHSSENMSGAVEHSVYMTHGCIVNVNIGSPGTSVKGGQWGKHRKTLRDIFVSALTFTVGTMGMVVSSIGSVTDPYDDNDRNIFDTLFKEAFSDCSYTNRCFRTQ